MLPNGGQSAVSIYTKLEGPIIAKFIISTLFKTPLNLSELGLVLDGRGTGRSGGVTSEGVIGLGRSVVQSWCINCGAFSVESEGRNYTNSLSQQVLYIFVLDVVFVVSSFTF